VVYFRQSDTVEGFDRKQEPKTEKGARTMSYFYHRGYRIKFNAAFQQGWENDPPIGELPIVIPVCKQGRELPDEECPQAETLAEAQAMIDAWLDAPEVT
jgi:hypothetical protein